MVSIPSEAYLVVKKKIKEQYMQNIFGSIIQIVLLFIGIIWGGLLGLIIARVITKLIWGVISIYFYEKSSREVTVI
jgi:O-antigen/teichoic acid export membrane protein